MARPAVRSYRAASNALPTCVTVGPLWNRPVLGPLSAAGSANQAYRWRYGRPSSIFVDAVTNAACCCLARDSVVPFEKLISAYSVSQIGLW